MASWNEPRARKRTQREINEGFDIIQNINIIDIIFSFNTICIIHVYTIST